MLSSTPFLSNNPFLFSSLGLFSSLLLSSSLFLFTIPTPELAEGISACVVTRGSQSFSSLDSARGWCWGQLREPELLGPCAPVIAPRKEHMAPYILRKRIP